MATIDELRSILARWDKGSKTVRQAMLKDFIVQCQGLTGPDLEQQFCEGASLFLARLTAWLRISYQFGTCLSLQLRAIRIFVSATAGRRFLSEFLEVGGLLTVLEVLAVKKASEEDHMEALDLLTDLAKTGRQCKELICESYGIKSVAESLAQSSSPLTQQKAQHLLLLLFQGNPHYQSQVYKTLIALLGVPSSNAQRLAAATLREVQPQMGVVSASIVDPALSLLRSLDLAVQHEACELFQELAGYEEVQHPVMTGLINLLQPLRDTESGHTGDTAHSTGKKEEGKKAPLPMHVQQAGASKVIGQLAVNPALAQELIEMKVVPPLLTAMGNTHYPESQRQAALTLKVLLGCDEGVKEDVEHIMGSTLFYKFWDHPDTVHSIMTEAEVDVLCGSLASADDVN